MPPATYKANKGDKINKLTYTGNQEKVGNRIYSEFTCDCGTKYLYLGCDVWSGVKKDCGHNMSRELYGEDYPFVILMQTILHQNRLRHLEVEITYQDIKNKYIQQEGKCRYTSQPLSLPNSYKKTKGNKIASVDRIDSTKGYLPDNIQLVTKAANLMKLTYTHSDFVKICKMVANTWSDDTSTDPTPDEIVGYTKPKSVRPPTKKPFTIPPMDPLPPKPNYKEVQQLKRCAKTSS